MMASKPGMGLLPIALESAARGILIPILSLILLSKGFTLSTLPAGLAACSIAILIFELPGGILSDWIGRKRMFLTAQIFYLAGLGLLLGSQTPPAAIVAMIFYGIAKAASSGSLDALTIDAVLAVHGKDHLARITARIGAVRAAGLALGSLAGGLLYQIRFLFFTVLCALILTVLAFTAALFFTQEIPVQQSDTETSAKAEVSDSRYHFTPVLTSGKTLLPLFAAISLMGIFISMIETYWQPRFSELLGQDSLLWLLGLLGFCYFGVSILGTVAAEPLLERDSSEHLFPAAYLLTGLCLIILSLTKHPALFFILYLLLYFFVSIADMALTVSINQEAPSSLRATILSLQSFLFQLGGLCGSLLSSLVVKRLSISGLWFWGTILFLTAVLGIKIWIFRQKKTGLPE